MVSNYRKARKKMPAENAQFFAFVSGLFLRAVALVNNDFNTLADVGLYGHAFYGLEVRLDALFAWRGKGNCAPCKRHDLAEFFIFRHHHRQSACDIPVVTLDKPDCFVWFFLGMQPFCNRDSDHGATSF